MIIHLFTVTFDPLVPRPTQPGTPLSQAGQPHRAIIRITNNCLWIIIRVRNSSAIYYSYLFALFEHIGHVHVVVAVHYNHVFCVCFLGQVI